MFDVFAVAVQIPFIFAGKWVVARLILSIAVSFAAGFSFNTLMDSKRQLDMYKADIELYYTKDAPSNYSK